MKRFSTARSFVRLPSLVAGCLRSLRGSKRRSGRKLPDRKRRVLLIDDESALTRLCRIALERTDSFIVQEENLGSRAAATAREFRPDVIFLDIRLPDKDGHAIAAEFKSDPVLRQVPIVFWSASLVCKKEVVANSHGCWPTLPKPFSAEELTQFANDPTYKVARG